MNRHLLIPIAALAALVPFTTSSAQESCTTVDYQGAPAELCPPPEPDPTNCYTGWYQGAPIEICMPTGESLPEGTTYHDGTPWAGQPVVIHNAEGYVPPAEVAPVATPTPTPAAAPAIDRDTLVSIVAAAVAAVPR